MYKVKILNIEQVTHNVKRFKVEKPKLYRFTPGQATEVAVNKNGFTDRFHPFTFTSLNKDDYLEFTIKGYPIEQYPDHSGVTEKIHTLKVGDEFIIKEPVGTIEYEGKGVFLAGGAGITPFIAIFRDLQQKNKLQGNTLIFSNKEKKDVIIENELKEMFDKNHLVLTLSEEKIQGYEYGRIDKDLIQKYVKDYNQYFYACGPSGFEDNMIDILISLGAKKDKIIIERW
jgi:hypothetical protein